MKVTLNWLKQYVDFDWSPEQLSERLTMLGLEVEGVHKVAGEFEGIVVGQILTRDKVQGSDKLSVCKVNDGKGERTIICGAPNHKPGDKVPLILPNFALPLKPGEKEPFVIKERKVFGITSQGMMCSPQELGLPDQVDGLLILPADAPVVQRMRALFKSGPLQRAPLDINEVVNEVCRLMRSEAEKRRVSLEIDLEAALPAILGDRVQIQQVLVNLCINGMDAMDSVVERRRTLTLRTRLHDSSAIRVEVRDSGIGLQHPDRVFETFFTTKRHGMGMGLPISRSIIESHGGRLWASANAGSGATFHFTLPN